MMYNLHYLLSPGEDPMESLKKLPLSKTAVRTLTSSSSKDLVGTYKIISCHNLHSLLIQIDKLQSQDKTKETFKKGE